MVIRDQCHCISVLFCICSQGSKINTLYHASRLMIESYLPDGSWLSVVDFDGDAIPLSDFVQLDSDVARHTLVSKLPRVGEGRTCIPCGTDLALSVNSTKVHQNTYQIKLKFFCL